MASTRNEPLSKEEQEEEEMKNELRNAGFNESMEKTEMLSLYNVLKESKEISFKNQKLSTLPSSNETKSSQNISQLSKRTSVKSMSSLVKEITPSSSNLFVTSSSSKHRSNNMEQNVVATLNKSNDYDLYNETSSFDNERISERNSSLNHDFPSIEGTTSPIDEPSNQNPTNEISKASLERWRLNPFKFIENESDVSYEESEHLHIQPNESCFKEEVDSESFDTLYEKMCEKLENLRENYFFANDFCGNKKFEWGSPIKVATKWNGSLDKDPPVEDSPEPDVSTRDTTERATKRKAFCNIDAAVYDSNDEISDDELIDSKKRKDQQGKNVEESKKSKASFFDSVEMIEVDDTKDFSDSEIFDSSDLHDLHDNSNIKSSISTESNYEQLQYPRRVPPPNPAKKNFKGPRAKKKNTQSKHDSLKKDFIVNDEEINKTLHELNEEIDDNDCVDITDEKNISTVPTHIQSKIQTARSYLQNVNVAEKQIIKVAAEAKKQKEIEERIEKDELISRRLQEQFDESNRRLEQERHLNEKQKFYTKKITKRITRSNFDKPQRSCEDIDEDILLTGDDDELATTHACPICHKYFPFHKIQSHAAKCDEFSPEPDTINDQQSTSSHSLYECHICNDYRTYDGNNYEAHVIECKERAEDLSGFYV